MTRALVPPRTEPPRRPDASPRRHRQARGLPRSLPQGKSGPFLAIPAGGRADSCAGAGGGAMILEYVNAGLIDEFSPCHQGAWLGR